MTELERLRDGAEEWFETGKGAHNAGHLYSAFESFRHAAELSCKAILLRTTGAFPRDHLVAAPLAKLGLLPEGVTARSLHQFLSEFTLGTYGFERGLHNRDVQGARRMAERMIRALRS